VIRLARSSMPRTGFVVDGANLRRMLCDINSGCPIDILEGPESSLATVPSDFPAHKVIRMHGGHHFFSVELGERPRPWRSWLERRSFDRADSVCAASKYVAHSTKKLLGLGDTVKVIPNPVDTSDFRPSSSITVENDLIVFVGTVCEKKGVRQLVQAMPTIVDSIPDARLWIIGRDWHDRENHSYTALLKPQIPSDLMPRIVFKGALGHSKLRAEVARATVCAYPSHMEALPIAWLEGMAMGKAIVASRTGPGPEVVEDNKSGLLCDPHDPGSIAEKIIAVLGNPTLARDLGAEARRRAMDEFGIESLVIRNEDFYRSCLAGAKR
jgi:glycosyltransferase involved in cell wall biosynthesis